MGKFLDMRHVTKTFGGVHALRDVDFDLEQGEIHCLVGQNGCGKSTLIKIIAGVLDSDRGSEISIAGTAVSHADAKSSMRQGICVIYQDLSLFPSLSVAENIAYYHTSEQRRPTVNWKAIRRTAQDALARINVKLDLDAPVSSLSIADRQLVAIARALAVDAKLLIMDEPTSSLTRKEVNALFRIVKDLQGKGITVLFVSHRLDEIIEIAERITVMRDGVKIATVANENLDDKELSWLISGERIEYTKSKGGRAGDCVLEVESLSVAGQFEGVSFNLRKGEILGIIGLLGSGRTELALSLFGMNPAESGKIFIEGREARLTNNRQAIRQGIAYVPEDRLLQGLVTEQSVESNITISILTQLQGRLGLLDNRKKGTITQQWIQDLNIKSAAREIPAAAMSGGNQQKIVLAKWLATNPRILILDQPTNGVDVAAKSAIYGIVRELSEQGIGVVIISDEVPEIYYNCARALVMHRGHIEKELTFDTMSEKEFFEEVHYAE